MTYGHVRVLPWDTPGIPPSVPHPYLAETHCGERIPAYRVPNGPTLMVGYEPSAFYCTQPKHDNGQPHACHLREVDNTPLVIIVWDGE